MARKLYAFLSAVGVILLCNLLLFFGLSAAREPVGGTVCFAVDGSVSMAGEAMTRVKDMLWRSAYALPAGTRAALIVFRNEGEVLLSPTGNTEGLVRAADGLYAGGETNISAGLSRALTVLSEEEEKRAIVLLTDGKNGEERIDPAIRKELEDQKIAVFPVGLKGPVGEELSALSEATGGVCVDEPEELSAAFLKYFGGGGSLNGSFFAAAAVLEIGVAGILLFGNPRSKKQRNAPLPNAGYLKREEIKRLL